MRAGDALFVLGAAVVLILGTIGLEACRDYRECRRGGVVLVDGPSRVGVPSHDRCVAYLLR
jgi:hypothetical protein